MDRGNNANTPLSKSRCRKPQYKISIVMIVVVVIGIFISCVWLFFSKSYNPQADGTLRFVSIVHRHGERAPDFTYPFDPYKDEEVFWPDGLGSLLQRGKVSMYELGRFLRHRYDGFLSSEYVPPEILVVSTHVDRCIVSAELVLAGLYPPAGSQIWNPHLLWQPVPVHTYPSSADDMLRVSKRCALLSKEKKQKEALVQKKIDEYQDLLKYLTKMTGLKVKTARDVNHIYNNLQIVEEQGFKLPEWARDIYPDKLKSLAILRYMDYFVTPIMTKLYSGVFIYEMLSNMEQKIDLSKNFRRRISLYSAHDLTLVRIWRGLNITQKITDNPYYGAALFIELHQVKSKYRVKILYKKGSHDEDLVVLYIKGCEGGIDSNGMCDLDTFSSALQSVAIPDFDEACRIPS